MKTNAFNTRARFIVCFWVAASLSSAVAGVATNSLLSLVKTNGSTMSLNVSNAATRAVRSLHRHDEFQI